MNFFRKDFLSLKDISAEEILYLLDMADTMRFVLDKKNKKAPHLEGKTVILLFYGGNSRTKLSYELAGQNLSAGIVDLKVSTDITNGGNLIDMAQIIEQMGGDFIIIRHPMAGSARLLAQNCNASVINAGDGTNENPTQCILDLLTIRNHKKSFKGLKVAFIGDIANSRVTRSNILGLIKLGANVCVTGPPTLIPPNLSDYGVQICRDVEKAVEETDVIMSLRMMEEKYYGNLLPSLNEYKNYFKIDSDLLEYAKPDAIIMHPGPINRGIEISSEVISLKRCLVDDQITNGVAVRMALLYVLSLRGGVYI